MLQKPEEIFKLMFLEPLENQHLEDSIGELLGIQGFDESLKTVVDSYSGILEFKEVIEKKNQWVGLSEILLHDITLLFAMIGEIKKIKLPTNSKSLGQKENLEHHMDMLDLLLTTIHHYYSLKAKSKFKYNVLINSLYLHGKETLDQFKQKIHENNASPTISFPKLIQQNINSIETVLLLSPSLTLNTPQCLKQMRCLVVMRKVFLDYTLNVFLILQKVDDRSSNEQIGINCTTRIFLLFSPLLKIISEQIKQLKNIHCQKLRDHYSLEKKETLLNLKTWFDILDIHFESNAQIRKLKLYVSTLATKDLQSWADLVNQQFQDSPEVLKEIDEIKHAPLDYQGIHQFAIGAFQTNPQFQQQIINGMKIIENIQNRFNNWIQTMKMKPGASSSLKFTDIYDLFHTLQEGRERSNFIRDHENIFLKQSASPTSEIKHFALLSDKKRAIFLEMVWTATQKKSYVKSIAWQLYQLNQPQLFSKILNFFSEKRSKSEVLHLIFSCFSEIQQPANEVAQQKKKQTQLEKNIAQLEQKARIKKSDVIFSKEHKQRKAAQDKLEQQKVEYKEVKRLTAYDLEDYLNERKMKFQLHLHKLREKRAEMSETQNKVSESTEMFVEAEININEAIQSTQSGSSETTTASLDKTDINTFEQETLGALQKYSDCCPAQGNNKKEYFENRQNEIKGILQSLREQAGENALGGGEMVHITNSVHDIMEEVEKTMHDLSEDLPTDAEEKLKILLQQEADTFNALMEKKFSFTARGKEAHYQLKFFIILPIPAKQKLLALQQFDFMEDSSLAHDDLKNIENFLHARANFTSNNPFDIVKDNSIQLIKLWNYIWYEELLYKTIPFGFTQDAEAITLLDLYSLPLEPEGLEKFTQHTQLIEKILQESEGKGVDEELQERMERDIKNKNFMQNVTHHFQYKQHNTTYNLFPGGQLDTTVFEKVKQWYGLRKEDQKINYYKLKQAGL